MGLKSFFTPEVEKAPAVLSAPPPGEMLRVFGGDEPGTSYVSRAEATICLKEKILSWSGDDFDIAASDGMKMFKVDGKVLTLRGKKTMKDARTGRPVLAMASKLATLHATYHLYGGDGLDQRRVTIRKEEIIGFFKSTMKVYFLPGPPYPGPDDDTELGGMRPVLTSSGDLLDKEYGIFLGDPKNGFQVAQVSRKMLSAANVLFNQDTYYVRVAPMVDIALITALVICLDEANSDHQKKN